VRRNQPQPALLSSPFLRNLGLLWAPMTTEVGTLFGAGRIGAAHGDGRGGLAPGSRLRGPGSTVFAELAAC
jgi:hypothetical protein